MIGQPEIRYTGEALAKGIEGTVRVSVTVKKDGRVAGPAILQGLGYGLDEQALAAVNRTQFSPATDDKGHPIDTYGVKLEVVFSIFGLFITPSEQQVVAGGEAQFDVSTGEPVGNIYKEAELACRVQPANTSLGLSLSASKIPFKSHSTLTVKTLPSTPPGRYAIQVTAKAGNVVHKTEAVLEVKAKGR